LLFLIAGTLLAKLSVRTIAALGKDHLSNHQMQLLQRLSYYLVTALFLFTALQQIGVNLGVLLGAAGILSVALGFASQTSASNVISGLFLLGEKPFGVGDTIRIGATTGEVLSIDLLSIKLRTFDNLFVRIPNETIVKSEVTSFTKFPIRRFDLLVGVAYKEDLAQVKEVLMAIAHDYSLCLEDPEPTYILQGFGESSINIQFSVWTKREHFLKFKNGMIERVKTAFDEHGIEIPFPHRTLYAGNSGANTPQLPVKCTIEKDKDLDVKEKVDPVDGGVE
jgi:small-conductance mechanosensitive channel